MNMIYNANLMSLIVLSVFNVLLVVLCFLQLEILKRRILSMREIEKELKAFLKTDAVEDIYNQVWERIKTSLEGFVESKRSEVVYEPEDEF